MGITLQGIPLAGVSLNNVITLQGIPSGEGGSPKILSLKGFPFGFPRGGVTEILSLYLGFPWAVHRTWRLDTCPTWLSPSQEGLL